MYKIILKRVVLFFIGILSLLHAFAQDRKITGTITDEKNITLPGATVTVKGTNNSVKTDLNGKFSLTTPPNAKTIIITFVGMETRDISIAKTNDVNVSLRSVTTALSDVVVIGYGTQKRGDISGAISTVAADKIANIPQTSVDQLLQGKAAGLTISQNSGAPGSNTSVHIRGITSLSVSNEPLYVIDGVPVSGDANNVATSGRSASLSNKGQVGSGDGETSVSPLALINPSDIESIDILKDASATAIYGARASNGVIIITTKRGKNGAARINYDGYIGYQKQNKFLDVMNLQQYAVLQNALADVYGTQRRGEFSNPTLLGKGTSWQKEVFKRAPQQSHQLSISGGKDGVDYYISGGYLKQEGTILGNNFDRYSFRANVNGKVNEWFKVGAYLSGNRSVQNQSLSDNSGIVYTAVLSAPDQAVYNPDGTYAGPQKDQVGGQINPVARALDITNNTNRSNFNGSIYNEIKFFKDLTLRSEINGDFNFSNAKVFLPTYQYGPLYANNTAKLTEYAANSTYWGWKEYLTYTHTFASVHNVTILAGHEVNQSNWGGTDNSVSKFYSNTLQTLGLGDALTATSNEYKASQSLESFFGRAIYIYNNKYSLTGTIRSDRSSKFAPGHQTGYFPSFGASWRLSDENFFSGLKNFVDNVKIRVGYGEVGNQAVPNYLYGSALVPFATGLGTGFNIDKISNVDLKWETAIQTNVGLDFSLAKNRIEASVDYFDKSSKNFLFQIALPAYVVGQPAEYSGLGVLNPPFKNGGKLSNKGFEFSLNTKNVVSTNFKWNSTFIFSHYVNKVISLFTGTPYIPGNVTVSFLNLPVTRTSPGGPVGEFYGYKVKGIFKTAADLKGAPVQFGRPVANNNAGTWLGDVQYVDINGDGKIDELDQTAIGNPNPKFTYSVTNSFTYQSFDLSVFLNGSYGAKIFNVLNYQVAGLSGLYQNQLAAVANFWTPANPTSDIPAPRSGDHPNLRNSDRFVEDGSYLRLQNVSLGYTLPQQISSRIKLSRLKVYVSGQNLYVFTKYKGLDPEIGALNQNVFLTNVDLGRYPIPRTITFGINAQFQ